MARRKVFGPKVVVTDDFRRDLLAWLHEPEKRRSARKLALALGCDPSMMSQLLNQPEKIKTSTLVVPIVQHTGIKMPVHEDDDEETQLAGKLRRLGEVDRPSYDAIAALIRARVPD